MAFQPRYWRPWRSSSTRASESLAACWRPETVQTTWRRARAAARRASTPASSSALRLPRASACSLRARLSSIAPASPAASARTWSSSIWSLRPWRASEVSGGQISASGTSGAASTRALSAAMRLSISSTNDLKRFKVSCSKPYRSFSAWGRASQRALSLSSCTRGPSRGGSMLSLLVLASTTKGEQPQRCARSTSGSSKARPRPERWSGGRSRSSPMSWSIMARTAS
mmetsp:Transcript_10264/g.34888  ORF Transcript_10264/g.34888 Transcript_10264/m.34888 type:complete len:227 (-) Transcript_10264:109-789(-)